MDNPNQSPPVAEAALRFHCPHCGQSLSMPANVTALPRKTKTCPRCKQAFELEIVVERTQRHVLTYLPPTESPPVSLPMEAPPIAVRPIPVSSGHVPPRAVPLPVSAPPSGESEDQDEDSAAGRPWHLWAVTGVLGVAVLGLAAALIVMFLPEREVRPVAVNPPTPPQSTSTSGTSTSPPTVSSPQNTLPIAPPGKSKNPRRPINWMDDPLGKGSKSTNPAATNPVPSNPPPSSSTGSSSSPTTTPPIRPLPPTGSQPAPPPAVGAPGWSIAAGRVQQLVVDGQDIVLPVDWISVAAWSLALPGGQHLVKLPGQAAKLTPVGQSFGELYDRQVALCQTEGKWDFDKLCAATTGRLIAFPEPILPHCWGNYYWQEGDKAAAIRHWNRAIQAEPAFAPAHMNLAFAALAANDSATALGEWQLAQRLNVQNAYGIAEHLQELRKSLPPATSPVRFDPRRYEQPLHALSAEQQGLVDAGLALGAYSGGLLGQAKARNNVGVYLLTNDRLPAAAAEQFRAALDDVVLAADPAREPVLVGQLLSNLTQATSQLGLPESRMYARLKASTGRP